MNINDLIPYVSTGASDDIDVAGYLVPIGTTTVRTLVVSNTTGITLTDDQDAARAELTYATYNTTKKMMDAINQLTYWRFIRTGLLLTEDMDNQILAIASYAGTAEAGVPLFFDTSTCNHRTRPVGFEGVTTYPDGSVVSVGARTSLPVPRPNPYNIHPRYNNIPSDSKIIKHGDYGAHMTGIYAAGTHAGQASTLKVYKASKTTDILVATLLGPVSAATANYVEGAYLGWGAGAYQTLPGEWIIVRYAPASGAITLSTLTTQGFVTG